MDNVEKTPSFIISVRFLLAIILFFGYCFQYMLKINMSIAIVCMVNNTALSSMTNLSAIKVQDNHHHSKANDSSLSECNVAQMSHGSHIDGDFIWDKGTQGIVLSSYFYGYLITQIPGGYLSYRFGGKIVLAVSMLIASVVTIILPFLAKWNYIALMIGRLIVGLAHGAFWPATSSLWAFWAPVLEKSRLCGMASAGAWIGNIIALPLGGFLCVTETKWPGIFYIFGAGSFVWTVCFQFLTTDSPSTHRFISDVEKEYIIRETKNSASRTKRSTPWLAIFKSKPCLAILVAHFFSNWSIYLFLTQLPTFLKDVLKYDIKSNGLISAIPYIACCILNLLSSIISDKLVTSKILSKTNARRLFGAIGFFVPLASVIGLAFVTCKHQALGIALLVIGISFTSCLWGAGHLVNINEVSGPFAGIFFGISNTLATIPGIIAPYIVGYITINQTQKEWQKVFIICAVFSFVGGVVYCAFCDGNLQPWASNKSEDEKQIQDEIRKEEFERNEKIEMDDKYTKF